MESFEAPTTIVDDIDVLKPDPQTYRPTELPEREDELSELHMALRPVTMGGTPHNCLIYGPTGQGKTVGVELKTRQLEVWATENEVDLTTVHVRCKGCDSSYHVLRQLVKDIREVRRGPGEDKPTGYQRKTLVEKVLEELEKIGGTIILVLDEIDAIGDDDYVLYELSRVDIDNVRLGLVGITNDLQFRSNLDADVRSSLGQREIHFSPYTAGDLKNILARRTVEALHDTYFDGDKELYRNLNSDVLTNDTIPLTAALSAQDTGDARQAIRLLRYACDIALEEDAEQIGEDHVRAAKSRIETQATKQGILSETVQRKAALTAVTEAVAEEQAPAGTTDLYRRYCRICEQIGLEKNSQNTFREKLNDLTHSNLLVKNRHGRGRGKGMTNTYDLSIGLDLAVEGLEEDETWSYDEITEEIREKIE
ncbi:cell division control protein 6 [Natronoarchaeum philippinense]|uniref:ORC1-type DNA replication protein n=1 Tax=Natronoarchaeum philippinense TaxID=558529 RepID=A0A285P5J3_NATPI|nr:AAA family ATPase [Natronoarchaeum philippinense]SNZ16990.1 cell division control protein 6 [Natronoarchaeum philippinense]